MADATFQEGSLWGVTQGYYHDASKPWPAPPDVDLIAAAYAKIDRNTERFPPGAELEAVP